MVKHWNIGFQKDTSQFKFSANPVGGWTINPTLHSPLRGVGFYPPAGELYGLVAEPEARTHYPTIPVFHHSNCERSELTCAQGSD